MAFLGNVFEESMISTSVMPSKMFCEPFGFRKCQRQRFLLQTREAYPALGIEMLIGLMNLPIRFEIKIVVTSSTRVLHFGHHDALLWEGETPCGGVGGKQRVPEVEGEGSMRSFVFVTGAIVIVESLVWTKLNTELEKEASLAKGERAD